MNANTQVPAVERRGNSVAVPEPQLPDGYEIAAGNQSLAVSLARAEVDQQIATARAMPRSITRAVANISTLATLDEQSAEECIYALSRGKNPIRGPSIRLAEIIAGQWGNCRVGARVVHVDRFEKYVEAEGVFHDLETNTATTSRVRRRLSDKNGRLFSEDMIVVTGNAACAIAKRNAILGGVPKAVWRRAYDSVESVVAGDVKTVGERRERALEAFAVWGVTPEQICAALGVGGVDDIGNDQMATLTGMRSAIKNGEATVEEMFPPAPKPGEKPAGTLTERMERLAAAPASPVPATTEAAAAAPAETVDPHEEVTEADIAEMVAEGEADHAAMLEAENILPDPTPLAAFEAHVREVLAGPDETAESLAAWWLTTEEQRRELGAFPARIEVLRREYEARLRTLKGRRG